MLRTLRTLRSVGTPRMGASLLGTTTGALLSTTAGALSAAAAARARISAAKTKIERLERELALLPDRSQKRVAVLGAGRSSGPLIRYLLELAESEPLSVVVADADIGAAVAKTRGHDAAAAIPLDIDDARALNALVSSADCVISMLPASFHEVVLKAAVAASVPMVTASYATPALRKHHDAAVRAGIPVFMECGVDPGIDHMSAKAMIDSIRAEGGDVRQFRSYTGGLVAEDSTKDNPWKYKLSWNPRNVVLAGQGVSRYLQAGLTKFIPYNALFSRAKNVVFPDGTVFEAYANRDSLQYIDAYDLSSASTVFRGTLRWPGFCEAWNVFVQLGLTDDSFVVDDSQNMTYAEFLGSFLPWRESDSVELLLAYQLRTPVFSAVMDKIRWLKLFSDRRISRPGTPAQILEAILSKKWRLRPGDRDLIGMLHKVSYLDPHGLARVRTSSLKLEGSATDPDMTAMARTVSLPVAIMAKRILRGEKFAPGIAIPTAPNIYRPVLAELEADHGISFVEHDVPLARGIHADHVGAAAPSAAPGSPAPPSLL